MYEKYNLKKAMADLKRKKKKGNVNYKISIEIKNNTPTPLDIIAKESIQNEIDTIIRALNLCYKQKNIKFVADPNVEYEIKGLKKIISLDVSNTGITSISNVDVCILNARSCKKLNKVENITSLINININKTNITTLPVLPNLKYISVCHGKLEKINNTISEEIIEIEANFSAIKDVSNLPKLNILYATGSALSSLFRLPKLTIAKIDNTKITMIPFLNSIQILFANDNPNLYRICISPSMVELYIQNTQISHIKYFSKLKILDCSFTNIKNLYYHQNSNLQILICHNRKNMI